MFKLKLIHSTRMPIMYVFLSIIKLESEFTNDNRLHHTAISSHLKPGSQVSADSDLPSWTTLSIDMSSDEAEDASAPDSKATTPDLEPHFNKKTTTFVQDQTRPQV